MTHPFIPLTMRYPRSYTFDDSVILVFFLNTVNLFIRKMKIEPDQLVKLISRSDQNTDDQRLGIFQLLANHYVIIPLKDGFFTDPEESNILNSQINYDWPNPSNSIKPIDRNNFSRHRAGILCGPISGIFI